jgi:hypothetical protein
MEAEGCDGWVKDDLGAANECIHSSTTSTSTSTSTSRWRQGQAPPTGLSRPATALQMAMCSWIVCQDREWKAGTESVVSA